jgi:hypothetical protein
VVVPEPKLELYRNSPLYRSILIYNKIPIEIKLESNINVFKTKLTQYLINKAYYSVNDFMSEQ